jgi:hypothetical protein
MGVVVYSHRGQETCVGTAENICCQTLSPEFVTLKFPKRERRSVCLNRMSNDRLDVLISEAVRTKKRFDIIKCHDYLSSNNGNTLEVISSADSMLTWCSIDSFPLKVERSLAFLDSFAMTSLEGHRVSVRFRGVASDCDVRTTGSDHSY